MSEGRQRIKESTSESDDSDVSLEPSDRTNDVNPCRQNVGAAVYCERIHLATVGVPGIQKQVRAERRYEAQRNTYKRVQAIRRLFLVRVFEENENTGVDLLDVLKANFDTRVLFSIDEEDIGVNADVFMNVQAYEDYFSDSRNIVGRLQDRPREDEA